jgi:hypothetical protein
MLRAVSEYDAEAIERSEKVIRQIEFLVLNIAALLGTVYFLLDHVERVLDWLNGIKR